jgi:uncharacterized protein YbjT (DUF2867 family)
MRLLVVGVTGSLGRLAVAEAAQRGHDVTALVRDPARANLPEPVVKVRGDVLDPVSLGPAVEGREAVVCALGTPSPRQASSLLEDGTRNLVAAMERASVPRLGCVTLLGTADSKRNASPLYRYIILRALAPMVPDKENQERVVRDSGLEWVLIRPPRFTSQRRGQLRVLRPGDKGRVGARLPPRSRPRADRRRRATGLSPPGDRRGPIAQGFPRVCRDRGRSGADCRDLGSLHHDRPSADSRPIGGYALLRAPASRPRSAIGFRRGCRCHIGIASVCGAWLPSLYRMGG